MENSDPETIFYILKYRQRDRMEYQDNHTVYAFILARGVSTGIPRKNLALLGGKPLVVHSILAAKKSSKVSKCFVSTEDPEIKCISEKWGATVIQRPKHLSTNSASSIGALLHLLTTLKRKSDLPENFLLLQPTSPLRTEIHINRCLSKYFSSKANSLVSVTEVEHHPYKCFRLQKDQLRPLFSQAYLFKNRQSLPKIYRQNGAIYIAKSSLFIRKKTFYIKPSIAFVMDKKSSTDVDNEEDLKAVRTLYDEAC